jgi:hypothetical protein
MRGSPAAAGAQAPRAVEPETHVAKLRAVGRRAAAGITGVKVDCQAGVGLIGSRLGGGPAVAARYHAALEASIARHFPHNAMINCMCHSTENLYRCARGAVGVARC